MSGSIEGVNRRAFVAAGLAATAGARLGRAEGPGDPPQTETPKRPGPRTVKLPRSGFETPVIGLGCPYLARWTAQGKPEEVRRILRYAFDRGIRFFDSGQLYPVDPVAGAAIAEFRDQVYISNKTHAAGPDAPALARKHVETALKSYRTDVIDCVKVHNAFDYDNTLRVLDALEQLRKEGKVRQLGLSTHVYYEVALRVIETGRLDEVMLGKGYFPKGYYQMLSERNVEFRELAIARAHERGMTVVGMKCLGGFLFNEAGRRLVPDFDEAKRARLPATALRWGFSDPRITLWAVGMDKESDVDRNLALISDDLALTDADRTLLAEYSAKLWQAKPIRDMARPFAEPGSGYLEPYIVDLLKRQGIDPEPYRRQASGEAAKPGV